MLQSPLEQIDLERLTTDQALKGGDPGFVFLHQVGRLRVVIQGTSLELADPDTGSAAGRCRAAWIARAASRPR